MQLSVKKSHNDSSIGYKPISVDNLIPSGWYRQFRNNYGKPDLPLTLILAEIFYWYRPKKRRADGTHIEFKFKGEAWQTSYKYLSEKFEFSKDKIRKILVKLEKLGIIRREFRTISVHGQCYNNKMFLILSEEFFAKETGISNLHSLLKEHGRKTPGASISKPLTPPPYPTTCGDHIYKETNIEKNRSNDKNDFLGKEKTETNQDETKTESQIASTSSHTPVPTEEDEVKAPLKPRSRAKAQSVEPKFLADFYPADAQSCELLRERSGRDFSNRFINQLLLALSKKPSRAVFYHFNGFLSYFAKVLSYEKRDATRCSSVDFYLKANMTDALKEELTQKKAQESYLLSLEESKVTDATSHMRKKIAQSWPRLVAYEFLQSWQSLLLQDDGKLTLRLNSPVFLSEHQQERLQELAREAYSLFPGRAGQAIVACKLEVQESPRESERIQNERREEAPSACTTTARVEPTKDPLSEQFQAKITRLLGAHIAKHWFKACHLVLDERENGNKATLLLVPNGLHQDWLERNYYKEINQVINQLGFGEVMIQTIS